MWLMLDTLIWWDSCHLTRKLGIIYLISNEVEGLLGRKRCTTMYIRLSGMS
jgi:hypothetical protein